MCVFIFNDYDMFFFCYKGFRMIGLKGRQEGDKNEDVETRAVVLEE